MNKSVVEGLKQFVRVFVLGMIPVLSGILLFIKSGINVDVGSFNINWMIALAMLVAGIISVFQTALMTSLDKWIYENDIKTPLNLESMDVLMKK